MPIKWTTKLIMIVVAVALLAFILLWGPAACQKMRSLGFQNKVNVEQGKAFGNSAADAVTTQGDVNANQAASEDITRANTEEIKNAKGASVAVDPAVHNAGLHAICARPSARNSERCRLFLANRSKVEAGR